MHVIKWLAALFIRMKCGTRFYVINFDNIIIMRTMGTFLPTNISFRQFFTERRKIEMMHITTKMHLIFIIIFIKIKAILKIYMRNYLNMYDVITFRKIDNQF